MLRYGRKMTKYLLNRAMRRLPRLRWTHNDDMLTTRQHKAVRQLHRKLLSKQGQLKAAIQAGQDDGAARRYSEFCSKEALSKHLKMLSKKE